MAVNIGKNQANGDHGGALNLEDFSGGSRPSSGGSKKKLVYLVVAALVLAVAIGGFSAYKNAQEVKRDIHYVVEELENAAGGGLYGLAPKYPDRSEKGGIAFRAGGRFDQLRNNKKLAQAIVDKMHDTAYRTSDNGDANFSSSQLPKLYRMAAVLEYLDYENEAVKAELDALTQQALAVAQEGGWKTKVSVYQNLLPYRGLTYYTGAQQLENSVIEAAYNDRWQEVRQEMSSGAADLDGFLDEVYETVGAGPITVPETAGSDGPATSSPVNAVYIPEPVLDINRIVPMEELKATLQQYGEQAIFRNGQGGYYDVSRNMSSAYSVNNNNTYGDFRRQYISGRVRRTGNEDEFTEKYLREHYDKPSQTYYYFKSEKINKLPPFFSDTREVYVYGRNAYAFTDYAVYLKDYMLPYDYETAKELEFKHVDLNTAAYQTAEVGNKLAPRLRSFAPLNPSFQYAVEDNMVTIYMQAQPGTTEALKQAGQAGGNIGDAPIPFGEDTTVKWNDLSQYLTGLTGSLYDELFDIGIVQVNATGNPIGVGLILISDVNPDAGLLSVLNGEVVQDNSADPPAPAEAAPDTEAPETTE